MTENPKQPFYQSANRRVSDAVGKLALAMGDLNNAEMHKEAELLGNILAGCNTILMSLQRRESSSNPLAALVAAIERGDVQVHGVSAAEASNMAAAAVKPKDTSEEQPSPERAPERAPEPAPAAEEEAVGFAGLTAGDVAEAKAPDAA